MLALMFEEYRRLEQFLLEGTRYFDRFYMEMMEGSRHRGVKITPDLKI